MQDVREGVSVRKRVFARGASAVRCSLLGWSGWLRRNGLRISSNCKSNAAPTETVQTSTSAAPSAGGADAPLPFHTSINGIDGVRNKCS